MSDRPPSVVISFKDGGRHLLVGGQVAVDKDGNVVGKEDMRAQIEEIGKNIQACLKAAGAKASDIVLTRAYVTDRDAFNRNTDVLARELGPRSSASTVATVSELAAGPDFLVEIEACHRQTELCPPQARTESLYFASALAAAPVGELRRWPGR